MELLKEFSIITKKYEDSMFIIFKEIIDEAKINAESDNLDAIDTFIYVNDKLRKAYIQLALAQEIILTEECYTVELNSHIMSEKLLERIYTYIDPVIECARIFIKNKAEEVMASTSLSEM